jgi:hypothetical protein
LDCWAAFEQALGEGERADEQDDPETVELIAEGERLRRSVLRELDRVRMVHAMDTFEWNEVLAGAGVHRGTKEATRP